MDPSAIPSGLADIRVRPGRGLRILLAADVTRSLAMAAGAVLVGRLGPRDGPWWLEGAGALVGLPWGVDHAIPGWLPWTLGALGLVTALTTLGCFVLAPRAMAWRRRLGLLALAEALFSGVGGNARGVAIALWTGAVWVGLLIGGLALSREVARVTGEEGLEVDPSHPRL